jgi:hypothetical protein
MTSPTIRLQARPRLRRGWQSDITGAACLSRNGMTQLSHTDTIGHKISGPRWALLSCMAVLAPVVADGFHSLVVLSRGIRFYQAEFSNVGNMRYWLFLCIRAVISFLVLWPFAKVPVRHRLAWFCCVVVWTYLAFKGEVVFK